MKRAERPGESETEPEAKKNKQDSLKQLFEIAAELSQISARPESVRTKFSHFQTTFLIQIHCTE